MPPKKVALVTGSSEGGIGFNMCQKLAERDFLVYATSRSISTTQDLVGPNIKRLALDVRDDSAVKTVVATIIEESGQIDLLINNAGILAAGPIIDWAVDDVKNLYDTNVVSIVRLCSAVVPHMAKRKSGTIVNLGSIVGEYPTPWTGIYDSSKAAVHALTEVLAMECKPLNIHVMLAVPGAVQSKLIDRQDDFQLAPNSIYGRFFHNIRARLEAGRGTVAMSTDTFAEQIISKAVKASPPRYFSAGGQLRTIRFLGLFPRWVYLWVIWGMFSKPK